jgi:hypothetical protein
MKARLFMQEVKNRVRLNISRGDSRELVRNNLSHKWNHLNNNSRDLENFEVVCLV